jgi:hypothetical protein
MAKLFDVVGITRHVAVASMPAIALDDLTDGYRLARTFLSQIHRKTLGNFALKARNWLDAVGCRLHLCELPLSSREQVDLIAGSEPCRLRGPTLLADYRDPAMINKFASNWRTLDDL